MGVSSWHWRILLQHWSLEHFWFFCHVLHPVDISIPSHYDLSFVSIGCRPTLSRNPPLSRRRRNQPGIRLHHSQAYHFNHHIYLWLPMLLHIFLTIINCCFKFYYYTKSYINVYRSINISYIFLTTIFISIYSVQSIYILYRKHVISDSCYLIFSVNSFNLLLLLRSISPCTF